MSKFKCECGSYHLSETARNWCRAKRSRKLKSWEKCVVMEHDQFDKMLSHFEILAKRLDAVRCLSMGHKNQNEKLINLAKSALAKSDANPLMTGEQRWKLFNDTLSEIAGEKE